MKILLLSIFICTISMAQDKEIKKGSLEWVNQQQELARKNTREAIEYYKKKYMPLAKKELAELTKKRDRYKNGLAKLKKDSKSYRVRKEEYDKILLMIKAQKLIEIFPSQLTAKLDAYDEKNSQEYAKKSKICDDIISKYSEYTEQPFPNFLGEYLQLKSGKKPSRKKRQQKFE